MSAEVFISYSSRDRNRVLAVADRLAASGVRLWVDRHRIEGGMNYGPEIVGGIKAAKVLMLMCSDASLHSRNVKQEVQLAWKYQRPYLPLLLDTTSFPEQLEYWLEGWQWIEVLDRPAEQWLPPVLRALRGAGVAVVGEPASTPGLEPPPLPQPTPDLTGLRAIAKFTDQIWPVPAERVARGGRVPLRDLGAPQEDAQHGHRLGSRVSLAIESDRAGHLLLLDEGTSGAIYCLCPSWFAPETRIEVGRSYVPQAGSRYESLVITGRPGREHLVALLTEQPLGLDWMPSDPRVPARVVSTADIDAMLASLRALPDGTWSALATYFDVAP